MKRMKYSVWLLAVVWFSCTGSLTNEQRKKIRENMEQGSIKKVSEARITEAAFQYGRTIVDLLQQEDDVMSDPIFIDSLVNAYKVEIISLQQGNHQLRGIERQLLEAYITGNSTDDNIQKQGPDSLLYTRPVQQKNSQGVAEFSRAIGIRMTRKQVVLSIKD